ncbi:MAG: quinolinate synthase NadA [Victivallaceae bacterium]|nr:quinolinate synthase NadA [Victivallaceae bacterium]
MNALQEEILRLKVERRALILAHNYVDSPLQEIADFVGDSLELSQKAAKSDAEVLVVCGVRFMAETAKLLSPDAIVLLPCPDAGCPMADMASGNAVRAARAAMPDATFVAYVNTTADTKAEVDICCTSGNAEKIVSSLPDDKPILFLPDRNLGHNVARKLDRPMNYWSGCCPVHDAVTIEMIENARAAHPGAEVLIHPECRPEVVAAADRALSTGGMLRYVRESESKSFIIATECGILFRLRNENPGKEFFTLQEPIVCRDMKKITLDMVRDALIDLQPRVELSADVAERALNAVRRMIETK